MDLGQGILDTIYDVYKKISEKDKYTISIILPEEGE